MSLLNFQGYNNNARGGVLKIIYDYIVTLKEILHLVLFEIKHNKDLKKIRNRLYA